MKGNREMSRQPEISEVNYCNQSSRSHSLAKSHFCRGTRTPRWIAVWHPERSGLGSLELLENEAVRRGKYVCGPRLPMFMHVHAAQVIRIPSSIGICSDSTAVNQWKRSTLCIVSSKWGSPERHLRMSSRSTPERRRKNQCTREESCQSD